MSVFLNVTRDFECWLLNMSDGKNCILREFGDYSNLLRNLVFFYSNSYFEDFATIH